ncbi:hypothetical protein Cha6605_3533 [Chamaesiphon minutus PCC 6605]|uniref:Uncharacterized protein n=1 Tax=Chamaesiphon minutus (strain ATCC 27169 / PCC 6605) TaxID=1173020 RepID=K9UIN4_CHAP6|nr:hypothetical protein Cha6605_3533 [Chamaesiphon minutus PCC 6605]
MLCILYVQITLNKPARLTNYSRMFVRLQIAKDDRQLLVGLGGFVRS